MLNDCAAQSEAPDDERDHAGDTGPQANPTGSSAWHLIHVHLPPSVRDEVDVLEAAISTTSSPPYLVPEPEWSQQLEDSEKHDQSEAHKDRHDGQDDRGREFGLAGSPQNSNSHEQSNDGREFARDEHSDRIERELFLNALVLRRYLPFDARHSAIHKSLHLAEKEERPHEQRSL